MQVRIEKKKTFTKRNLYLEQGGGRVGLKARGCEREVVFVVFKVSLKVKYDVLFIPSVVGLGRSIASISFDLYFV